MYLNIPYMDPMGHRIHECMASGWTNPFEKYARQNWIIFPRVQGENKKNFELPPTRQSLNW